MQMLWARALRVLAAACGLAFGLAAPAAAVDVEMSVDVAGCTGYVSGVGVCDVTGQTQITITWTLSSQQTLNGYDLALSWDPGELTLLDTAQLYPDTATPFAWVVEPSDPLASTALVISLVPGATTSLFALTFAVSASPADGQPDIVWSANGNGLSPASVVLDNPGGAGIDVTAVAPAVPALPPAGLVALALALLAVRRRQAPAPSAGLTPRGDGRYV